jgi:DNA-binding response OmpR family regulator
VQSLNNASTNKINLVMIDGDLKFCRLISTYLSLHGYTVVAFHDGDQGVKAAQQPDVQAVILDVMLPGLDGFQALQKIRERTAVPVLMLTALGEETHRIVALELGADAYLIKSASPRELLARLRSIMRSASRATDEMRRISDEEITVGELRINRNTRQAFLGNESLLLTAIQFDLLSVLAQARGRVKSRAELLDEVRNRNYDVLDRSIDVHISALRCKLRDDPRNPHFIYTIRSVGYMLVSKCLADQ